MSRLANEHSGYLDVDKLKLRHRKYANVYGLGDCLNIPTCKTLAATSELIVLITCYIIIYNILHPIIKNLA